MRARPAIRPLAPQQVSAALQQNQLRRNDPVLDLIAVIFMQQGISHLRSLPAASRAMSSQAGGRQTWNPSELADLSPRRPDFSHRSVKKLMTSLLETSRAHPI